MPVAPQTVQLLVGRDFCNFAVRADAQGRVADVGDRNKGWDTLLERRFNKRLGGLAAFAEATAAEETAAPCSSRDELRFVCDDKIETQIDIQPKPGLFAFELRHRLLEQLAV